jgi:hypothetical protein
MPFLVYGLIVSNPSLPSAPASQGDHSSSLLEVDSPVSGPVTLVTRRTPARGPTRRPNVHRGFHLDVDGATLSCGEIHGFRDALVAASDPRTQAPLRLAILATSVDLDAWLDAWSEDATQVRRTITIRRRLDDKRVTVIATLASHGFGVDPSIAIESVVSPRGAKPPKISRSGTYLKVDVAATLGGCEGVGESERAALEPTCG